MKQGGLPSSPFAAERRERLRQQTGQAVQRLNHPFERSGTTTQPGDLLVLPTCEAALWWLVLKAQDQTVTLIPGDDRVWTGLGDLRVPTDFFPGPLTLRCAFLTEADANNPALANAQCVGQLPAALLRQATDLHEAFESGTLDPSPRQEDDDFDPFYQDWIQEAFRPALATLAAPAVGGGGAGRVDNVVDLARRRTSISPVWLRALAAVLTVALVGVGWGWWGAQRELGEFLTPSVQPESLARFERPRERPSEVQIRHGTNSVVDLNVEIPYRINPPASIELLILSPDAGLRWRSGPERWPRTMRLSVRLPRKLLEENGIFRLTYAGEPEPWDLKIRLLPPGIEPSFPDD